MKRFTGLLAIGLAVAMAANAQTGTPIVPPSVSGVAIGGQWSSAKGGGPLRVVIADHGFEHIHSQVWIEWLDLDERGRRRLAARVLVKELSGGFAVVSLGDRREVFRDGRIRLLSVNPYAPQDKETMVEIEPGAPGRYKIIE